MAIRYRITKRKNTMAATHKEQFIMQAVNTGTINIRELSEEISIESTLSIVDVHAVIMALGVKMQQHLENGKILDLGDVGKFKIGFQSKAADKESDLSPLKSIKKFHLNFQPSVRMKRRLKNAITVYKEGSNSK